MEKIKHYAIYDILSKEEVLSLLIPADVARFAADWEAKKKNIRIFNTCCIELPSSALTDLIYPKKHLICTRLAYSVRSNGELVPGRYQGMTNPVPGLVGNGFWWQTKFSATGDTTIFIEENDGQYRIVNKNPDLGTDVRIFTADGHVYAYDRYLHKMYQVEADYSLRPVYKYWNYSAKVKSPHQGTTIEGPNRSIVKLNLSEEVVTFIDGFYREGVLLVDIYGKNRSLQIVRDKIQQYQDRMDSLKRDLDRYTIQRDAIMARMREGGPRPNPEESKILPAIAAINKDISEISPHIQNWENFAASYAHDYTSYNFLPDLSLFDYRYIPFDPEFGISMSGSHLTGKQEDMERYRSNYGIMPLFSLSSPLIETTHPRFGKCYLGLGHTKIQSVTTKKYAPGSTIGQFRDNLYADYEKLYPGRFVIHGLSHEIDLAGTTVDTGYIYMMYFYVLTMDGKMYVTDSYIPFDAMARQEYVFALTFPMSVYEKGDYFVTSGGEGDYYSYMAKFKKSAVMVMRWHDISHCDMREYGYYFYLFLENGEHKIVSRLV